MRKKAWPIVFGLMIFAVKVGIDSLAFDDEYNIYLLPAEILYAVIAFDVWSITEEFSGAKVIASKSEHGRNWLILLLFIHLFSYLGYLLIYRDNPSVVATHFAGAIMIVTAIHLVIPCLIAFDFEFA